MPGIKVKLIKSYASVPQDQVDAVHGLGLYRFGDEKILKDTPAIRGMVFKVKHLVSSEDSKEAPKPSKRRKPRKDVLRRAARAKAEQSQK